MNKRSLLTLIAIGWLCILIVYFVAFSSPQWAKPTVDWGSAYNKGESSGAGEAPALSSQMQPQTGSSPNHSKTDFSTTLRQMVQINDPAERMRKLAELLQNWVSFDQEEALLQAPGIVPDEMREEVSRTVVQIIAAKDPETAARYALNFSDPTIRARIMDQVFCKIAEANPQRAVELLQGHMDVAQSALMANLVQQWAAVNLNSAYDWANRQDNENLKDEFMKRIAFVLSQSNPQNAAEFILDHISPGPVQTEAAVSVVHQWALRDISAAIDWAGQFPQGPLRERVLNEISGITRIQQDLSAAGSRSPEAHL